VSAFGRLFGVLLRWRSPASNATAWAVALIAPPLIAVVHEAFRASLGLTGFLLFALLGVVLVALVGGWRPALAAVAVGFLAGDYAFAVPYNTFSLKPRAENAPLVVFVVVGAAVAVLVDQLGRLLEEQTSLRRIEAALRRVATLGARAASAEELFGAASREVGRLLAVDLASMGRFEDDGTVTMLAGWRRDGRALPVGSRRAVERGNLSALVAATGRPARIDSPSDASGVVGAVLRGSGIRSAVAAPITVQARLWGIMIAGSIAEKPLALGTEAKLADFTELLASAIANAESRDELAASRVRIVAAADEQRRRVVRDLHDGAQSSLVRVAIALQLALRRQDVTVEVRTHLGDALDNARAAIEELRELVHGIHPAVLTRHGLAAAVSDLADRASVPVTVEIAAERYPSSVELAAYFVTAEALTNVVKYARASRARVATTRTPSDLVLTVDDDGIGGAQASAGSGLAGLADRIEALGGTLSVSSQPGDGTHVRAEIPLSTEAATSEAPGLDTPSR
jgi:signal transduction histidine kinase